MNLNNNNPGNQQPEITSTTVEKFHTQSGQLVELRLVESKVLKNSRLRKEQYFEVVPPLADNRVPDSVGDIRECCICLQLYHKDNVNSCPGCGRCFCLNPDCRDLITTDEGKQVLVCAVCADEANSGLIKKLWRKIWILGD